MELFVKIVSGYKPFTIFSKSSILDVASPDPPLKTATLWLIIGRDSSFFKWHHQNFNIFAKFSARDSRDRSIFLMLSQNSYSFQL